MLIKEQAINKVSGIDKMIFGIKDSKFILLKKYREGIAVIIGIIKDSCQKLRLLKIRKVEVAINVKCKEILFLKIIRHTIRAQKNSFFLSFSSPNNLANMENIKKINALITDGVKITKEYINKRVATITLENIVSPNIFNIKAEIINMCSPETAR